PQGKIVVGATPAADSTLQLDYRTSTGEAKSITLNVANGATKAAIAQSFMQTFGDQLKADGLEVTADAGDLTINSTKQGAQVVATTGTGTTATQTNQAVRDFTHATLASGDEFKFSVNIGGTVTTAVLRVIDGSGAAASLGTDADGNTVVGIGLANLTDAAAIATQVQAGLEVLTQFDGTGATAGTDFGLSRTGATLTITSADAGDFLTNISLPDADFSDLLSRVEAASKVAVGAAQAFGSAEKQVESQQSFLKGLMDSLETGVGAL